MSNMCRDCKGRRNIEPNSFFVALCPKHSAADDLLAACKLALTFTRGGCPDPKCSVCKRHTAEMDQLRAAIAKAEGE